MQPLFFSNLGLLLSSFDWEFHKNFRDIQVLHAGPKLVDFYNKRALFLTLVVDFLTTTKKARDPRKENEINHTDLKIQKLCFVKC